MQHSKQQIVVYIKVVLLSFGAVGGVSGLVGKCCCVGCCCCWSCLMAVRWWLGQSSVFVPFLLVLVGRWVHRYTQGRNEKCVCGWVGGWMSRRVVLWAMVRVLFRCNCSEEQQPKEKYSNGMDSYNQQQPQNNHPSPQTTTTHHCHDQTLLPQPVQPSF